MAYNVEKLSTIDLGRQGENLARTVEIDVQPLLEQWPDAVISLLCKRKHDTNPYIAVTEVRDGILIWPITSVETETAGDGKIELRAVCGEVIAKSMTAVIRVTASLTGSETEAPDAAQGWVDQVLAAGSAAESNAKVAQDAATRAENAISNLDAAVDDAEASAWAAEEQADLAGDHASAAGLSATEAEEDAQRAEQAATSAEESAVSAQNIVNNGTLQGVDIVWRRVRIRWGEEMTLGEWMTYLAEQYSQGTPVTIQYPTSSSIITTGQAEHITSTTGLTALNAISMGLTEPDPDHPCEITMQKSVTIKRTGKNLIDVKQSANYEKTETGLVGQVWATPIMDYNNFKTFIRPGARLTTSGTVRRIANPEIGALSEQNVRIGLYSPTAGSTMLLISWGLSDDIPNIGSSITKSETVILPAWVCYEDLRMLIYGEIWREEGDSTQHRPTFEFSNLQIEAGSVATEFEPYQGDAYSTDMPEDFSGGEANVTEGTAYQKWASIVIDDNLSFNETGSAATNLFWNLPFNSALDIESNMTGILSTHFRMGAFASNGQYNFLWTSPGKLSNRFSTVDELNEYCAAQHAAGTPVVIYYKPTSPILHEITAHPIPAVSGVNTLVTDADSMTVSGHADPIRIITNLTERVAALEDAAATE